MPATPIGRFEYSDPRPPLRYRCSKCKIRGVKLWREYNTFADHNELFCINCAEKDQNSFCKYSDCAEEIRAKYDEMWRKHSKPYRFPSGDIGSTMPLDTEEKRELSDLHMKATTDSISWLVPAVPTEDGDSYWGYTSVPQAGCDWWERLPLRNIAK